MSTVGREEGRFAKRGGCLMLVRDRLVVSAEPGPVPAALRAGQPVEVYDYQLPSWARGGTVQGRHVRVYPDGRVVEAV
jgi:hypothetical protein